MQEVTCLNCGQVHAAMSKNEIEEIVTRFNDYFNSLTKQEQELYYGGKCSTIDGYMKCTRCGSSYKNFRDYQSGDCPNGITINPIMDKNE